MTVIVALLLAAVTSIYIWQSNRKWALVILHIVLLLATPWFLSLIIGRPSLKLLPSTQPNYQRLSTNLSYLTSDDFLFFVGDGRPQFGTQDHGVFLLSFLPLILIGVYYLVKSHQPQAKLPFWWLISGLTITVVFGNVAGLPAALWYLPALSTIATIGSNKALEIITSNLRSKQSITPTLQSVGVVQALLVANFLWLAYEALRLYHVIIIHQPFAK